MNRNSVKRGVFKHAERIRVAQVSAQLPHIFRAYVYTLTFEHAATRWSVARTHAQLRRVHFKLKRMIESQAASKTKLLLNERDDDNNNKNNDWPRFPIEPDHFVTSTRLPQRCRRLAVYFERVLAYPPFRDHPAVCALLGVSNLSFADGLAPSLFEGSLLKRSRDYVYYGPLYSTKFFMDKV